MEIILSPRMESITGYLNKKHGYYIRRTKKNKFIGQRAPKKNILPNGHLNFILDCAQIAKNGLYMTDIKVTAEELYQALFEAGKISAAYFVERNIENCNKSLYNARDIINLKITYWL